MLPTTVKADEISVIKQALATSHDKIEASGAKLPAIKHLKRNGFISNSPDEVYDYSDIYFPLKHIQLFGARLIALDHEYRNKTGVGCCVSPGISVLLIKEKQFDLKALTAFAKKHTCTAWSKIMFFPPQLIERLDTNVNSSDIVELSCKERDRQGEWGEKAKKFILRDPE